MNDHQKIRELLSLAAADVLDSGEERLVSEHIRSCDACAAQLESLRLLAGGLRRLPTPQPRGVIVERARAMAQIRLTDHIEQKWNRAVMSGLIVFAWILTLMSWPVVRFVSGGFLSMLDPRFSHTWLVFGAFTTLVWVGGASAAVLLSQQQRRERRFA
jgi:predicted anti-sigma-YlaC factor YlaD